MKLATIIVFTISLYFSIGGVGHVVITKQLENARAQVQSPRTGEDGVEYRNIQELRATDDQRNFWKFYPMFQLSTTLSYLIILMSFGALGSLFRQILATLTTPDSIVSYKNVFMWTVLGMVVGLAVVILDDMLLPEFKYESGNDKVYYAMAFLGGVYTETLFKWLSEKINSSIGQQNPAASSASSLKPKPLESTGQIPPIE